MSLQSLTIGFVGAGNMAEAIFRGLLKANAVPAQQIVASDRHPDRLSSLAESYGLERQPTISMLSKTLMSSYLP